MQLHLGQSIRALRKAKGDTQEVLAAAIGVTSQAVSRWEADGGYPDMEMIPSIAGYFGVSIDELFGYHGERTEKIEELVSRIAEMNLQNNGVDKNIDECIALARNAAVEFPGNEKILLCLSSVLYNAGYVRYGEHHLTDEDGYDVYDAERHRTYAEWREAISLYEKLLKTMQEGKERHRAIRELTQLYLNVGEGQKALEIAQTAPTIYGSREFLRASATDGKNRAEAYGQALLKTVRACSELMVSTVLACKATMSPAEKVQSLRSARAIFDLICTDGNCGVHHAYIARIDTLLSLYLWLDGKRDDAFEALDHALAQFRRFEACTANAPFEKDSGFYTAPLVRLVHFAGIQAKEDDDSRPRTSCASLAEDWPWWSVPEDAAVRKEMQSDPRWGKWVAKLR